MDGGGGGGGGGGDQGGMNSLLSHSHSLDVDHHHHGGGGGGHFHEQSPNDFFDQILSSAIPSWAPSDLPKSAGDDANHDDPDGGGGGDGRFQYGGGGKSPSPATAMQLLQQQLHSAMLPGLPLSLATTDPDSGHPSPFKSQGAGEAAVQALYNGFAGSLPGQPPPAFHPGAGGAAQNYGGSGAGMNQPPAPAPPSASTGGSSGTAGTGATASQKQNKPRARRGQATDPHSIAERLRRERIAERMKALQELVPNANKTDKASMLDEIIDYVKFLQLQVKVLSMSRLGGAGAVAPLVADMSSEGGGAGRMSNNTGNQPGAGSGSGNESSMTVTEHQVAKLMEEDMGSAMQYLQGKGLCLMPISLATAISTATCHSSRSNNPLPPPATALGRALLGNNGNHDNGGANHPPPVPSNSTAPVEAPTSPTASRD